MNPIPSPMMTGPRLADAWRVPPAPAASAAPLDPMWQRAIERAEPPGGRDVVRDAPGREPPFAYRTDPAILGRLPPRAAALLRRLDTLATEARDRTLALSGHLDTARDRAGRVSLDVHAAIRAAGLPEAQTADQARTMAALGRWPAHYTEPMRSHVARIVAEAQRHAEAEAEVRDLSERIREHSAAAAPVIALRSRLVEAAARLRPPVRPLDLPEVPAARAAKALAEARRDIEAARAEVDRLERAGLHPDDAPTLAAEAVRQHAERASPHRFIKVERGAVTIREPHPTMRADDEAPIAPLALLCAVAPDLVAAWLAAALPVDPDAPRLADRPRLIAEARARLREAEITERACLAALGDDPAAFRPDADRLIALGVEAGR